MKQSKSRIKKKWRIIIWIIGSLLLLTFVTQIVILIIAQPKLEKALNELIVKGSDSLYQFRYDKMEIRWWPAGITITNFQLSLDSARYKSLEKKKLLPLTIVEGSLSDGRISGISIFSFLFSRIIKIKEVDCRKATIQLSRHYRQKKDDSLSSVKNLYQLIQPDIKAIYIDRLDIREMELSYRNVDSAKAFSWKFGKGYSYLDKIAINEKTSKDSSRILYAEDVFFSLNNIDLKTSDGLYIIQARELNYSSLNKRANIDSFRLRPTLSQAQFYKKVGHQQDRYFLQFPEVRCEGFELGRFVQENYMVIDSIILPSPIITVYNDRTIKPFTRSKLGNYPNQLLQKAPFLIHLKKLKTSHADVSYIEKDAQSKKEVTLSFLNTRGVVTNITNDSNGIETKNTCVADLRTTVLGKTSVHTVFTFYLNSHSGRFSLNARFGSINQQQLNPLTVPLANLRFKTFQIEQLSYAVGGNERSAKGNIHMRYRDLKIELLEIDRPGALPDKKTVASFLANRFGIWKENPKDGEERKANVIQQRDVTRSFFNLVWKTLLKGMQEIALKEAAQRFVRKKNNEVLNKHRLKL